MEESLIENIEDEYINKEELKKEISKHITTQKIILC